MPKGSVRPTCTIDGCSKPHYGRGWCRTHWARWVRNGTTDGPRLQPAVCSVPTCGKPASGRGWCGTHYARWRANGTVELRPHRHAESVNRYRALVDRSDPEGCWLWLGFVGTNGYGVYNGRPAHRVGWEAHFEVTLPTRVFLCHHCDVPLCQNLDHLFKGDHAANMLDMSMKGRHVATRHRLKVPDEAIPQVHLLRQSGLTLAEVGAHFGISGQQVGRILAGARKTPRSEGATA